MAPFSPATQRPRAAAPVTSQDVPSSRMAPPSSECARPRVDYRPQSSLSLMHLRLLAAPATVLLVLLMIPRLQGTPTLSLAVAHLGCRHSTCRVRPVDSGCRE